MMFMETTEFQNQLQRYLTPLKKLSPEQRAGWICGLGPGVLPKTPETHVRLFVQTVRQELR